MFTKNFVRVAIISLMMSTLYAQNNEGRFKSISVKALYGAHMYAQGSLVDKVSFGYTAMDVRFAWHPSKDNLWTADTGFASYGFGFYRATIGDPEIFGEPTALYGFVNFFLSRPNRRNVLEISPAFGITYRLEPYDAESNPTQDALGARAAVYFNLNFGGAYKLTRELDLLYGIDFTHYSDGRIVTPNAGLNLFGLNAGMRYHFNQEQRKLDADPFTINVLPARFNRPEYAGSEENNFANSIDIYAALGTVQNASDAGTDKRYGTFSGVLDYRYYFNRMHGFTAGLDFFVDNSLVEFYPDSADRSLLAAHVGYDFMFWKFAFRFQVGTYITDNRGKGNYFMRPAIQYKISKSVFAQIGLKTKDRPVADWVEFGIGWKPFKW